MEHYSNRSFVKISEIVEKVIEKQFFLKKTKKIPAVDCGGSATIMTTGVKSLELARVIYPRTVVSDRWSTYCGQRITSSSDCLEYCCINNQ